MLCIPTPYIIRIVYANSAPPKFVYSSFEIKSKISFLVFQSIVCSVCLFVFLNNPIFNFIFIWFWNWIQSSISWCRILEWGKVKSCSFRRVNYLFVSHLLFIRPEQRVGWLVHIHPSGFTCLRLSLARFRFWEVEENSHNQSLD